MPVPLLFTDHMTVTVWSSSYSNILFTSFHSAYNHTGRPIVFTFLHSIVLLPPPRAAVYKPYLYFMKVGQHPLLMRDWEAPGGPNPILRKFTHGPHQLSPDIQVLWLLSPKYSFFKKKAFVFTTAEEDAIYKELHSPRTDWTSTRTLVKWPFNGARADARRVSLKSWSICSVTDVC